MPKFIVTVTEVISDAEGVAQTTQETFKQSVDSIDLKKVFDAVNYRKRERKPRTPKAATPSS